MIEEFYEMPPSERFFPLSKDTSQKYQDKAGLKTLSGVTSTIVQRNLLPVQLISGDNERQLTLFGYYPNSKDNAMKCYLFERAATFKLTHVGACSFRASHAAICLARIFAESNVTVALTSAPTKDQFAVLLGNKAEGWFVYDPLTNPDMIFEHKYYQENILPTFKSVAKEGQKFQLTISKELVNDFDRRWPKIKNEFSSLLNENEIDTNHLLRDRDFIACLQANKVKPKKYKEITDEAITYLKATLPVSNCSHQNKM
jgi:hypothetical protein